MVYTLHGGNVLELDTFEFIFNLEILLGQNVKHIENNYVYD